MNFTLVCYEVKIVYLRQSSLWIRASALDRTLRMLVLTGIPGCISSQQMPIRPHRSAFRAVQREIVV
jgi:hypothetical protein